MDIDKYISSGILERYLTGRLTKAENWEVYQNITNHAKIKEELLAIEAAILELSKSVFPKTSRGKGFDDLINRIAQAETVSPPKKRTHWRTYWNTYWSTHGSTYWNKYRYHAAVVLSVFGLLWFYSIVSNLKSELEMISHQNLVLEHQVMETNSSLKKSNELLNAIRDEKIKEISLSGQDASPTSFAKIYWNQAEKKVYIDAKGLPEPPDGFVYQAWSSKEDQVGPTSIGLLEGLSTAKNKIFVLSNPSESEAFGITLESLGGSETPTLEYLYALGKVSLK